MEEKDFVQGSVLSRGLENKLLTKDKLMAVAETQDYPSALAALKDTEYGQYLELAEDSRDYELILGKALQDIYKEMYLISPSKILIDILAMKYTYHNFKAFTKGLIKEEDMSRLYYQVGTVDMNAFAEEFETGKFSNENFKYGKEVQTVLEDYKNKKDSQRVGLLFDQYYYKTLIELVDEFDNEHIRQYVQRSIDFTNVKTMFRLKKQNLDVAGKDSAFFQGGNIFMEELKDIYHEPVEQIVEILQKKDIGKFLKRGLKDYQERGHLSAFDKAMEDYQMDMMRATKNMAYGPEILFNVLLSKEIEIRNLRILLAGKITGFPAEDLIKRLRDTYV